jgi:hypothetical protein
MKTKLTIISIISLVALNASPLRAQPPAPPAPPSPPAPAVPPVPPVPGDRHDHDKAPKVPVTWMGVETSNVPRVVSEQLGLPKGFGLVVDYVVPEGPAAAAGVQTNDIIRLLNDQILVDTDQLSKLVRSYSEGTTVTLTILRKGQEQKVPVKLGKKEMSQHNMGEFHIPDDFMMGNFNMDELRDRMNELKENLASKKQDLIQSAVMRAHEEVDRARERAQQEAEKARAHAQRDAEKALQQAQRESERARDQAKGAGDQAEEARERAQEQAQEGREQAQEAREEAFRNGGKITITNNDPTGTHTTHIDLSRAQIVFSDDKGELRIDSNSGKKILTAKDPQGRLLFSGPVETKEDIDKIPTDVRDRFNKLQEKDLPQVTAPDKPNVENDTDQDSDSDMNDEGSDSIEQVKLQEAPLIWKI